MDKNKIKDCFSALSDSDKDIVMWVVAYFHYRDGTHNADGSMGIIKITPKQFNDCLAFVSMNNRKSSEEHMKYTLHKVLNKPGRCSLSELQEAERFLKDFKEKYDLYVEVAAPPLGHTLTGQIERIAEYSANKYNTL